MKTLEQIIADLEAIIAKKTKLKKFEFSVDVDDPFPDNGGGNVLFQRSWFIQQTVDMVPFKVEIKV